METCCEFHPPKTLGPGRCPQCKQMGNPVDRITVGALVKPERRSDIPAGDKFNFCKTSTCDVVYFLPERVLFRKGDLSIRVGLKEPNDPTIPVCYCFGWTPQKIKEEIEATGKTRAVKEIKTQVKAGNCYCEVTNPQGSCCLGNVAKLVGQKSVIS